MKQSVLTILFCISIFSLKSQSIFDTLTLSEKVQGISTFWKEVSYNFVFFDKVKINWDSAYQEYLPRALKTKNVIEYHKLLSDFARILNDGHTYIGNADYFYKDIGGFPLKWKRFDKQFFIRSIDARLIDEIPYGTEIIKINGLPVDSFLKKYYYNNYIFKGVEYDFTFQRKDKNIFNKKIISISGKENISYLPTSSNSSTHFEHKSIGTNYYIKINSFADSTIHHKFISLLSEINNSKGLIIDIRDNGGGNSDYARKIAEYLVKNNYTISSASKSRLNNSAKKALGSVSVLGLNVENELEKKFYEGNVFENILADTLFISSNPKKVTVPIVILIGENTYSAAEDFLIFLDKSSNITLVGNYSYGSSGQPLIIKLPKGLYGYICSKRDTYPDGRDFVGIGIKPDVFVSKSKDDFFNNKDTELEAAIEILSKKRHIVY